MIRKKGAEKVAEMWGRPFSVKCAENKDNDVRHLLRQVSAPRAC